ncbi:23522_t:CDS:2 [Gigaspora margarita]|uniref:23522_t:CDS:1 n=1 Tax=Gigaspora margarita TaxID=4874 RepID=A0ABN7V1P8_GIGMA|nr:23522_t:CDS:2 [Gigaspora margarita]
MKLFTVLLCICFFISTIYAGCVIQYPYANTVWMGGNTENVTWADDNASPSMVEIGDMQIDLMKDTNNQTKVITLATLVHPTDFFFACPIPNNIGPEADDYGTVQPSTSQPATTDNANNPVGTQ